MLTLSLVAHMTTSKWGDHSQKKNLKWGETVYCGLLFANFVSCLKRGDTVYCGLLFANFVSCLKWGDTVPLIDES